MDKEFLKCEGLVSIFLKLPLNDKFLGEELDKIEEFEPIREKIKPQIIGSYQIGPVLLNLGKLSMDDNSYDLIYNHDRFLLEIRGKISKLSEAVRKVFSALKNEYDIAKTCRFVEFQMRDELISWTKGRSFSTIKVEGIHELNKLLGSQLNPHGIYLSSSPSPLESDWISVSLLPESMSTSGRYIVTIIKRFDSEVERLSGFLENLGSMEEILQGLTTEIG